MQQLVKDYGLDYKEFRCLLSKMDAQIAGSSVLSTYLNMPFIPNDIDIFIRAHTDDFIQSKAYNRFAEYLENNKYYSEYIYLDKSEYRNLNNPHNSNNEELKKRFSSQNGVSYIQNIIQFKNNISSKSIQIIIISDITICEFISLSFDLSICMCYWNPKNNKIRLFEEDSTKKMQMFINTIYDPYDISDITKQRIEKYISRGFSLIPAPAPIIKERDLKEKINTPINNTLVYDIINLIDIPLYEHLIESEDNIILCCNKKLYAYSRQWIINYISKKGETPLNQKISKKDAEKLRFADHSIFVLNYCNLNSIFYVTPYSYSEFICTF